MVLASDYDSWARMAKERSTRAATPEYERKELVKQAAEWERLADEKRANNRAKEQ